MARGGFPGMGGMNMNNLVKQAQKMQKQMAAMQEELNEKTLEMTSGGGAVKVVISGKKEIKERKIQKSEKNHTGRSDRICGASGHCLWHRSVLLFQSFSVRNGNKRHGLLRKNSRRS